MKTFTLQQVAAIQKRWKNDPTFLGFPDAERDAADPDEWLEHFFVRPHWFEPATEPKSSIIVGRKGVGKSAARIAAVNRYQQDEKTLVIQVSADELAARHSARLQGAAERGFGAVADWCHVYADLIVRHVAMDLAGTVVVNDDKDAIRRWAVIEGVSERDFGERVASAIKSLVPWAKKLADERDGKPSDDLFRRVAAAQAFALYIDDFDNLQENGSLNNIRLIRDAIEAADRVTHQNSNSAIHLMLRQDLWLRLRPGWHYSDKVAGLVHLNWGQDDLRMWARRRLKHAAATALGVEPSSLGAIGHDELWQVFFPGEIVLRNDKESSGLHYMVRRTMYTPRALRQFMVLVIQHAKQLPADLRAVEDAEEEYSVEQIEFMKTEFGGLCEGLDVCLQSFTGKPLEMRATDLYKHLNGLIGNGQVRLAKGASDGTDAIALARFLFRIGFLEVRYQQDSGRYEVRDSMRHPDHWKSIRKDDAVKWAVRSAFYCALRAHR